MQGWFAHHYDYYPSYAMSVLHLGYYDWWAGWLGKEIFEGLHEESV